MMNQGDIPEHMRAERRLHVVWTLASGFSSVLLGFLAFAMVPPLIWMEQTKLSLRFVEGFRGYLGRLADSPFATLWNSLYGKHALLNSDVTSLTLIGITALVGIFAWFVGWFLNPYRSGLMIHGSARFATPADVRRIDEDGQMGPSGPYLHLGYYGRERLALKETLSSLVMAPPGTGKTVRFVIPGILASDTSSMVFYDPKPELWEIVSGWRSSIGPAYRLDWSKQDFPAKGEFHPRFNFLAKRVVPTGPARDTFVDSLAKTLIPESSSGDRYFQDKGRAALTGFVHFLVAKVNDRSDPDRYEGLPEDWKGKDASLSMLVDWINTSQQEAATRAEQGEDPLRPWMQSVIEEAQQHGYPQRCVRELQPMVNMADKERSGILGTMDQGLLSLKNQAVVERTSDSDFVPSDLRGMLTKQALKRLGCKEYPATREDWAKIKDRIEPGDWEPVTVGICINQADAPAFSSLTTLFLEICSKTLLAFGPGEETDLGVILGPFAMCFMMDEFAKLSKSEAVLTGPDLGRSKKTYYCLIAQDIAQIRKTYSAEDKDVILSTTALKFILPQNSPQTVDEISKMSGSTTIRRKSLSRQVGLGRDVKMFGGNQSEQLEKGSLLSTTNLTTMPPGKHIVLMQGHLTRPIWLRSATYYNDKELAPKAWNPRTKSGLPPAGPMPEEVRAKRMEEHEGIVQGLKQQWDWSVRRYDIPVEIIADTPRLSP